MPGVKLLTQRTANVLESHGERRDQGYSLADRGLLQAIRRGKEHSRMLGGFCSRNAFLR